MDGNRRSLLWGKICIIALLACSSIVSAADGPVRAGEDWPWFLGPTHDGVSTETNLLKVWPDKGLPEVWHKTLGTGYSAPSVRGQRLVIPHRLKDDEIVECLDAVTGESLWKQSYPTHYRDRFGFNNGPRCSPVLTETHCYVFGAEGKLTCLTLDLGKIVWQRDLNKEFTLPETFFGAGCSPLLEAGKLIVFVGGQPNSGVVAFDLMTGKTLWENVGKSTWEGAAIPKGQIASGATKYKWTGEEMIVSYASPIAATFHEQRHLLCFGRQGLVSLDPENGQERFHYWFRPSVHESVNGATPVVVGDTILLSAAYKLGAVLLRVKQDGKSVEEVWRNSTNLLTHWSTAIHHEGHYFGFSGRHEQEGELRCLQAKTGEVIWQTMGLEQEKLADLRQMANGDIVDGEGRTIPFPLYGRGSAIMVEGNFIVLAEKGTLSLVSVDAQSWKEISRCKGPHMKAPCWTAPVLSRGRLYLRCENELVCLDLTAKR